MSLPPSGLYGAVVVLRNVQGGASTPGDVDGDGLVNVVDLLLLLGAWGPCAAPPAGCPADVDGDGFVSVTDFLLLIANWT